MATQKSAAKTQVKPVTKAQKTEEAPEERIESAIGKAEKFIYDHGKQLLILVAVIAIVSAGYMAYKHILIPNRAEKAGNMMFVAQQNFKEGMYDVALNGDGNNAGFLDVISKFGRTPQGNIAAHYAGICYSKLGDYENALTYLAKYRHTDGVPNAIINAQNYGLQGDLQIQLDNPERAIEMYNKAISTGNNKFTSPLYLKKVGLVYMKQNRIDDAETAFQRILDEYPQSLEARDIEKYLGAIGR